MIKSRIIGKVGEEETKSISLLCATLFAIHPVHVESVASIVGRADLLCCLFSLLAFFEYKNGNWIRSMIWIVIGTLSKEIAITTVAILISYEIIEKILPQIIKSIKKASIKKTSNNEENIVNNFIDDDSRFSYKFSILKIICVSSILVGYLIFRKLMSADTVTVFRKVENPLIATEGLEKILTMFYLHSFYVGLLLAPIQLCVEWSYNCIPTIKSISDYRNLFTLATYLFFIFVGLVGLNHYYIDQKRKTILIGLIWFVIPFIPSSNIFVLVGTFIAERLLYVPSIGWCILFSYIWWKWVPKTLKVVVKREESRNRIWKAMTGFILIFMIARTMIRNEDWKTRDSIFLSSENVCPNSAKRKKPNSLQKQIK